MWTDYEESLAICWSSQPGTLTALQLCQTPWDHRAFISKNSSFSLPAPVSTRCYVMCISFQLYLFSSYLVCQFIPSYFSVLLQSFVPMYMCHTEPFPNISFFHELPRNLISWFWPLCLFLSFCLWIILMWYSQPVLWPLLWIYTMITSLPRIKTLTFSTHILLFLHACHKYIFFCFIVLFLLVASIVCCISIHPS